MVAVRFWAAQVIGLHLWFCAVAAALLVADPRETITPFSRHEKFVEAMLERGRRVELVKAWAAEPPYHAVSPTFLNLAYECVSQRPAP